MVRQAKRVFIKKKRNFYYKLLQRFVNPSLNKIKNKN